jgi:hypothetical protein
MDTAYSQGGLNPSVLLDIKQGAMLTTSTTTAKILLNGACSGSNVPPSTSGPPSILFSASNTSYLGILSPSNLEFGTNDFTVEWFQYMTSNSTSAARVFAIHPFDQTQIGLSIEDYSLGGNDRRFFVWYYDGSSYTNKAANATVLGAWHHIAIVGSGGINMKLFIDGSNIFDETVTYNIGNPGNWRFTIGGEENGTSYFDGYITNFRALNGTALYTSNFTVPSIPLQNIANTQLLMLTSNSSAPFKDYSSNNYVADRLGSENVGWSSNTPSFPF